MDTHDVVATLSALAQPTRLETLRLLMAHEPDGIAAGEIARLVGVPQNTMSTHLGILARVGLVSGTRQSRSITYRASIARVRETVGFLLRDCCQGHPELCGLVVSDLTPCCTTVPKR